MPFAVLLAVLLGWAPFLGDVVTVCAQETGSSGFSEQVQPRSGAGGQILLTNSGFGLGGYLSRQLNRDLTFVFEISLGSIKDEKEVAFFDRFGRKDLPNKANYLLALPVQVGVEHRLFRARIEDNFRPFLHLSIGPTVGWKYPYFRDSNGNGLHDPGEKTYDMIGSLPKGSFEMGLGGVIALGAYFGDSEGVVQSVRVGYSVNHFLDPIDLLETSIRQPSHFFGSPVILVSFGTMY